MSRYTWWINFHVIRKRNNRFTVKSFLYYDGINIIIGRYVSRFNIISKQTRYHKMRDINYKSNII